jgi:SAM-dependent methyltransferase
MKNGTQHQFGYSWNIYREVLPEHEAQFKRWISPMPIEAFKGTEFLDAGCGMGRNSYWALRAGAKYGLAFDFDERSVAAAKENLSCFDNCTVKYKSIYDVDDENRFDIVFSVGVIHHLADPKLAISNLVHALRPGGKLVINVYSREGNETYLRFFDPVRRNITSRLPPAATRILAKACTCILWAYLRLPQGTEYLRLLKKSDFRNLENIIFDQMIPSIANYWRKDEVLDLVESLPLDNINLNHTNRISWTLIGEKKD